MDTVVLNMCSGEGGSVSAPSSMNELAQPSWLHVSPVAVGMLRLFQVVVIDRLLDFTRSSIVPCWVRQSESEDTFRDPHGWLR